MLCINCHGLWNYILLHIKTWRCVYFDEINMRLAFGNEDGICLMTYWSLLSEDKLESRHVFGWLEDWIGELIY